MLKKARWVHIQRPSPELHYVDDDTSEPEEHYVEDPEEPAMDQEEPMEAETLEIPQSRRSMDAEYGEGYG